MGYLDKHLDTVRGLENQISRVRTTNLLKGRYYDGEERIRDLGISLPPQMRTIDTVVGWPGTAVDVVEERLDFEGWAGGTLEDVYLSNDLDVEAPKAHLDALIYGTSFIAVSRGQEGEPDPLITAESPLSMTAVYDSRRRAISAAGKFWSTDPNYFTPNQGVLFLPNETIYVEKSGSVWDAVHVDQHDLGRVPVSQMVNRPRTSHMRGRSEITPAVRGYTDAALRTLVGSEVAREFYAVPQRWMMGAPEEFFVDENGDPRGAWDAVMGRVLAIGANPDTNEYPEVGTFPAHSTTPFFEQIRNLAQMLSSETSIPPMYLGFATDQASSADAIRAMEARLVKRAERRQSMFGKAWTEVARLSVMIRDGIGFEDLSDEMLRVRPVWRDPSTPTKSAAADAAMKLSSAKIIPPRGEMMMRYLGLNPTEREMLRRDWQSDTSLVLERMMQSQTGPDAARLVYGAGDAVDGE